MVLPLIGAGLSLGGGALSAIGAGKAEDATRAAQQAIIDAQRQFGAEQQAIGGAAQGQFGEQAARRDALMGAFLGQLQGPARQQMGEAQGQQFEAGAQNLLQQVLGANQNLNNASQNRFGAAQQEQLQQEQINPLAALLRLGQEQQGRGLFEQRAAGAQQQGLQELAQDTTDVQFQTALENALLERRRQAELFELQRQMEAAQNEGGGLRLAGTLLSSVGGLATGGMGGGGGLGALLGAGGGA